MNKQMLTLEQVEELLSNDNVSRCSPKAITYSSDFKINAVKQYAEAGMGPREIFRQAGFNLDVIGKSKPKSLMRDWNRIYRAKGAQGLLEENRGRTKGGGRPRMKDLTDAEKIKKLELEVAYLKSENDFLARLRARKAE